MVCCSIERERGRENICCMVWYCVCLHVYLCCFVWQANTYIYTILDIHECVCIHFWRHIPMPWPYHWYTCTWNVYRTPLGFLSSLFLLRLLRFILDQLQQLEWGLLVVDEVQVMPARTFRSMTAWQHVMMESAPKDSEQLDFRRNQE